MHQFRDKKQLLRKKRLIRTIILSAIFLALFASGFVAWTSGALVTIGRPLLKVEESTSDTLHDTSSLFRTKASVFSENETLKQQNSDLRGSMIDYQILKTENDQLKELLGRVPAKSSMILGTILAKPNSSPYDTIIIDIGADVGLIEGQRVFANGSIPIGKISSVYANSALVVLYSSPGETTEAQVSGSNASVELTGRGGGNFEMSVPLLLATEKGASVVLPNIESQVVAIVEDVISTPTDPLKKVLLRSPVNIQELKWVQVKKD